MFTSKCAVIQQIIKHLQRLQPAVVLDMFRYPYVLCSFCYTRFWSRSCNYGTSSGSIFYILYSYIRILISLCINLLFAVGKEG